MSHTIDTVSSASRQHYIDTGRYLTTDGEDPVDVIAQALRAHSDEVFGFVASYLAMLGSKTEWSMDDNFDTTEGLVELGQRCGLPSGGDQSDDALLFYGTAAGSIDGETFDAATWSRDDNGDGLDWFVSRSH